MKFSHKRRKNLYTGCMKNTLMAILCAAGIAYSFAPVVLAPEARAASHTTYPIALTIPHIGLGSRVLTMGLTAQGDLDVPAGTTQNVGWYANGTVPGDIGSAVMDAHVFAAFSQLHTVVAGDDIYVSMDDGTTRHFIVQKTKLFNLSELSPNELYNQKDGRYLHLITCAGQLTADRTTYTQRLVVYATLVR